MPDKIFVPRKEYFDKFKALLHSSGGAYVLNLRGIGGRGKTKILSHMDAFCEENKYPRVFIDFFHAELHTQINRVEQAIVENIRKQFEMLGIDSLKPFSCYEEARHKAEEARKKGEPRYGILRAQAKESFISDLSQCMEVVYQSKKKCVFLFDTFELVKYNPVGLRLVREWLPALKNAVVVLSGRQLPGELEELLSKELLPIISDLAVGEFTEEEAIDYLRQRNVADEIGEHINRILELSERHPLRLALVADRLHMQPKIEIEQLIEYAKEFFEKDIVQNLYREAQQPESLVFPIIAHIHEPLTHELMGVLFVSSELSKSSDAILEDLTKYSFIKKTLDNGVAKYWFQDEVRSLFHKYIFDDDDEAGANALRIATSKKMIGFYDKKISRLTSSSDQQDTRYLWAAEKSYYEIFLDNNKFDGLKQKFQDLRETFTDIRYANIIFGVIHACCDDFLKTKEYQCVVRLLQARSLRDNGYAEQSVVLLKKLLDDFPEPEDVLDTYNTLGATYEHLGMLTDAIECYEKSFNLREQLSYGNLWRDKRNIAKIYRELGFWQKSLDYIQQAYEYVFEYGEGKRYEADTLFEMGHTCSLLGNYDTGLKYCSEAIQLLEISEEQKNSPMIAVKKSLIANMFYAYNGEYEKALAEINSILSNHEINNQKVMISVYFDQGFILFMQGVRTKNQTATSILKKAKEAFNLSIGASRELYIKKDLMRALHEVSHVLWLLGEKKEARKNNNDALKIAEEIHSVFYIVNCLVGIVEFDVDEGIFDSVYDIAEEIKSYEKDYHLPRFYGRIRRIMGDIEMLHDHYDKAFEYYAEAFPKIAEDSNVFSLYSLDEELEKLEEQLQNMKLLQDRIEYCKYLREMWKKSNLTDSKKLKLIEWVNKSLRSYYQQNRL